MLESKIMVMTIRGSSIDEGRTKTDHANAMFVGSVSESVALCRYAKAVCFDPSKGLPMVCHASCSSSRRVRDGDHPHCCLDVQDGVKKVSFALIQCSFNWLR